MTTVYGWMNAVLLTTVGSVNAAAAGLYWDVDRIPERELEQRWTEMRGYIIGTQSAALGICAVDVYVLMRMVKTGGLAHPDHPSSPSA